MYVQHVFLTIIVIITIMSLLAWHVHALNVVKCVKEMQKKELQLSMVMHQNPFLFCSCVQFLWPIKAAGHSAALVLRSNIVRCQPLEYWRPQEGDGLTWLRQQSRTDNDDLKSSREDPTRLPFPAVSYVLFFQSRDKAFVLPKGQKQKPKFSHLSIKNEPNAHWGKTQFRPKCKQTYKISIKDILNQSKQTAELLVKICCFATVCSKMMLFVESKHDEYQMMM